jgi:hypothetical protein
MCSQLCHVPAGLLGEGGADAHSGGVAGRVLAPLAPVDALLLLATGTVFLFLLRVVVLPVMRNMAARSRGRGVAAGVCSDP